MKPGDMLRPLARYFGFRTPLFICFVFLSITLVTFGLYYKRTLQGDLNYHILSGEMFGIPPAIKDKGLTSLYRGPGQTGWDGQFYYFMANDLMAIKDTPKFIDHPAYRYQRIGLSLYAASVAKLLGRDWVSPSTFLASYLALVLIATWAGARLFSQCGLNPALILIWSLSVGTQITLYNALPDAAADSFLILALFALLNGRYAISAVPLAFAALSREIYILFPAIIFAVYFLRNLRTLKKDGLSFPRMLGSFLSWHKYYALIFPCLLTVAWHGYVASHFSPDQKIKPANILGMPFAAWWDYIYSGYLNQHLQVGSGFGSAAEANCLLFFILVLLAASFAAIKGYATRFTKLTPIEIGIVCTTIVFVAFYVSFGSLVIFHYTGYIKALSVFFLLLPLICNFSDQRWFLNYVVTPLLIVGVMYSNYYNLKVRILPDFNVEDRWSNMTKVSHQERQECFGSYPSEITIKGLTIMKEPFPWSFLGTGDKILADVRVKNTSSQIFRSSRNFGSVHLSYQWELPDGSTLDIAKRTAILDPIHPGETAELKVISPLPYTHPDAVMIVSLVQEGCAWFYKTDPQSQGQVRIAATFGIN
jgi:hypothetical protein